MSIGNRLKLHTRPSTKTLETTGGCHGSGLRSGNSAIASTRCISLYHLDSLKILALILAGWSERCQQSRIYQLFSFQTFTFGVLVKDFSAKTVPDYASFWCSSTISRRDLWLGRWRTQLNKCSLSSLSATSSTKKTNSTSTQSFWPLWFQFRSWFETPHLSAGCLSSATRCSLKVPYCHLSRVEF